MAHRGLLVCVSSFVFFYPLIDSRVQRGYIVCVSVHLFSFIRSLIRGYTVETSFVCVSSFVFFYPLIDSRVHHGDIVCVSFQVFSRPEYLFQQFVNKLVKIIIFVF